MAIVGPTAMLRGAFCDRSTCALGSVATSDAQGQQRKIRRLRDLPQDLRLPGLISCIPPIRLQQPPGSGARGWVTSMTQRNAVVCLLRIAPRPPECEGAGSHQRTVGDHDQTFAPCAGGIETWPPQPMALLVRGTPARNSRSKPLKNQFPRAVLDEPRGSGTISGKSVGCRAMVAPLFRGS